MTITFEKLNAAHFPLLLKWLMTPHVRIWWDSNIAWSPELIEEKYGQYVHGYKQLSLPSGIIKKPMYAYIILKDGKEIGYIQYYKKQDFPSEHGHDTSNLPAYMAALDWYIGEPEYLLKNIGSEALNLFMEQYISKNFDAVFVDPDTENVAAIRTYEKAGFVASKVINGITCMLKDLRTALQ